MQMDAEFEKEQIGTHPFRPRGGSIWGVGGVGGPLRAPALKFDVTSTTFFLILLRGVLFYIPYSLPFPCFTVHKI
jgi:hypothetical protein